MISINGSPNDPIYSRISLKMRGICLGLVVLTMLVGGPAGCADKKKVALNDLETGIAVVEYLLRHDILLISSFTRLYPRTRPRDFIEWMFSAASKPDWPVTEAMIEANPKLEDWRDIAGYPVLPKSVHLVPHEPDPQYQKQVVVKVGDGTDSILAEAYLTPDAPPVLSRDLMFPELQT